MKLQVKFPKIKIHLPVVLWLIFLVIIVIEGLGLYQNLYLNLSGNKVAVPLQQPAIIRINEKNLENFAIWLKERQDYKLPLYQLSKGPLGRENPFAEYR